MIRDIKGQPRSHHEMRFALTLLPCPDCGTQDAVKPSLHGNLTYRPIYKWTCPGCGAERGYRFRIWPPLSYDDPPPPGHLGGAEPSRLIAPDALAAEARRRSDEGVFFGHIAYASLVARKPA